MDSCLPVCVCLCLMARICVSPLSVCFYCTGSKEACYSDLGLMSAFGQQVCMCASVHVCMCV